MGPARGGQSGLVRRHYPERPRLADESRQSNNRGGEATERFDHDIFRLTPFIETMGRLGEQEGRRPKEFWWEREWRHAGTDLSFYPD